MNETDNAGTAGIDSGEAMGSDGVGDEVAFVDVLDASTDPQPPAHADLSLVQDVPVDLVVEIGRARMTIREMLAIGRGSIIALDKLAGEPADLLVNGRLVARGEVVAIDEEFGLRVTEILSPERVLEAGRS